MRFKTLLFLSSLNWLAFVSLVLLSTPLFSQKVERNIRFEHLTSADGLSTVTVRDIIQDQYGFMWFATTQGLNKYDGYKIDVFNNDPLIHTSLSDNNIKSLYEDSQGDLWAGTRNNGLNKFNRETNSFTRYTHNPEDSSSICGSYVLTICEDSKGDFWIGTSDGLNKMNRETGTFIHYKHDPENSKSIIGSQVVDIHEDQSGEIWIATSAGLSKYDRGDDSFTSYVNNPDDPNSLSANLVYAIHDDGDKDILWLGTVYGLNKFNKKENTFETFLFDSDLPNSNRISRIAEDSYGNLWTSVRGNGLVLFNRYTQSFISIKAQNNTEYNLKGNIVSTIYEDRSKVLWVGSTSGGINIYKPNNAGFIKHDSGLIKNGNGDDGIVTSVIEDSENGIWVSYLVKEVSHISEAGITTAYTRFNKNNVEYLPTVISSIFEDGKKNIWILATNGIYKLDKQTGIFNYEPILFEDSNRTVYQPYKIIQAPNDHFWIGSKIGLIHYNTKTKIAEEVYAPISGDNHSISSNTVYNVYEDKSGVVWAGTINGLNAFNSDKKKFTRYQQDINDPNSISGNVISCFFEDSAGRMWVGTSKGLNRLNKELQTFERYNFSENLVDNSILSIQEDTKGNLWLCSIKSIYRFNIETGSTKVFNKKDGIPVIEFYENSGTTDKNGHFYFGELNGYLEINPDLVEDNQVSPEIRIVDFKLSNKSVLVKNDSSTSSAESFYLEKDISVTDTITLSYLNKIFSFEFVSLDFISPTSNQYAYKMEGFEESWTSTTSQNRIATYTNLNPGTYTFTVKGSNNDVLWNEEGKSVVVIITPPWWETTWAYSLYVISFLVSLFGFVQWRASKLKRDKKLLLDNVKSKTKDLAIKNNQLDQQNLQLQEQADKLKELDESKSIFFTNISHEFRTPLTVILGLANKQIANATSNDSKDTNAIKRNANRLLQLINQLLDLSKIEADEVKLNITKQNILSEAKKIILLFESFAKEKSIVISFNDALLDKEFPDEIIEVNFDKEQFSKIISNLLSNAIKFTQINGKISIDIRQQNEGVRIHISNTGDGIPVNSLPHIFNRFYQVDDDSTREYDGTGIGLALVKELVELHQGRITVESDSKITSFKINFPLNLPVSEKNIELDSPEVSLTANDIGTSYNNDSSQKNIAMVDSSIKKTDDQLEILIVEDNQDIRNLLKDILEKDYKVVQAVDGLDGLEKAETAIPDLIISDVMMPNMDGYELCNHLKTNENTNHIPVIMLTAKASHENKLEGLEIGADDYLTKPFDEKELRIRIKNLISIREKLQIKYRQESLLSPTNVKVSSVQQKFIEGIKEVIEKNMDNSMFSVDDLGEAIAMSRSQVHRKLKAITDQSATQFIRNYRLHRAADLLKQEYGNVTEIAYKVGFSSQTYFSKCFQELFGSSPSDYERN